MEWYCDVGDKTINIKSKRKQFQTQTHDAFSKCIRIGHNIQNPDFFDIKLKFHKYITQHNKKLEIEIVK